MKKRITILLNVTQFLKKKYNRSFTLDGRLVGDIGEALAKETYNIELHPENTPQYDAIEIGSKRQIQIKSTMKGYFTFPFNHTPDFLLALKITNKGEVVQIYNGPGHIIKKYIVDRKLKGYKNSYYSFSLNVIKNLDGQVKKMDRIKRRITK